MLETTFRRLRTALFQSLHLLTKSYRIDVWAPTHKLVRNWLRQMGKAPPRPGLGPSVFVLGLDPTQVM